MGPCDDCAPRELIEGRGPNFQFTYGREDFHGPTVRERREDWIKANAEQGRELGRDYESAGNRWV